MFWRKNKFDKIKRTDVVDKIINYEQERENIEEDIIGKEKEIQILYKKGYSEKNPQLQRVFANKIKRLKSSNFNASKRMQYLDYSINVLEKLKNSIDDQEFMKKNSDDFLVKMLGDSKSLQDFLSKSVTSKKAAEENLVGATKVFEDMDEVYEDNEDIYGMSQTEEDIIAQFERGAMMDDELGIDSYQQEHNANKEEV